MWRWLLPFLEWWPEVTRSTLRADLLAGLTGAVVVLPQGVAFATIAGMPPEYGLYCAMVPATVGALLGSSRLMMSGPTTPTSIVLFSSLFAFAAPGSESFVQYALTLTFMVGVIQLAMGLARLGYLVDFISDSVILGFTTGAAVLIFGSQIKDFLGLDLPQGMRLHELLQEVALHPGRIDWMTVLVGVASIGAGILARRLQKAVPYMIVAMAVGTLVSLALNTWLDADVALVRVTAGALPPLSSPTFQFGPWRELAPAALAMAFFALTQSVSISRSMAARTGDRMDANQEFIAQGLSNLVGPFLSSYVSAGSFNRSAVNYEAGARTPLASLFAASLLVAILLLVAPLLAYMPKAATAGVLFLVAVGLVDVPRIRRVMRASRSDAIVLLVTMVAALLLTLDFAILLGVMGSIVFFLNRTSRPRILVRVPDPRSPRRRFGTGRNLPECPQMKIIQIDGALFFGAANYVAERLRILFKRNPEQRHLLILCRSVTFIDAMGAEVLGREHQRRRSLGGSIYLHQLPEGAKRMLARSGYLAAIGEDHLFDRKGDAIAFVFERLDRRVCARCTRRIFNECKTLPRPETTERERTPAARGER